MAAELARHGVSVRIIDKALAPLPFCRAIGVTPRTLEIWDDMGVVRPMIDAGVWIDGMLSVINGESREFLADLSDLPFGMLGLPQYDTERLLTEHLASFGVTVERGVALETLSLNGDESVDVTIVAADGSRTTINYRYVVGCDGAHSAVRHALEIPFTGEAMPYEYVLGDVHIDWDVPRGLAVRALRPHDDGPPEMLICVPLPEAGRYRVSTMAPPNDADANTGLPNAASGDGIEHGIQSERPAPGIELLQQMADELLVQPATLSDLRWSSIFRISMRLADRYRRGNAFIAGDAAHIHPPTGGQGMNTGIQDAYNLAWKLALVARDEAPASLLDSYEVERRAEGEKVIARTLAASLKLGHELPQSGDELRLADTQVLVNYRESPWVERDASATDPACGRGDRPNADPIAGDRAPDSQGLRRHGVGFPLRLHEVLRGTEHVLLAYCPDGDGSERLDQFSQLAVELQRKFIGKLRTAAIVAKDSTAGERAGLPIYRDAAGMFAQIYGEGATMLLIRPDGYVAWRGGDVRDAGLNRVLQRTFG